MQSHLRFIFFYLIITFAFVSPSFADLLTSNSGVLQGLDKVTARVSTLPISIGNSLKFGTLKIELLGCHYTPPEEPPDSAAYLMIWETRTNHPPKRIFNGWMFSSSPGLNALEHPVYDIWVLNCVVHNSGAAPQIGG